EAPCRGARFVWRLTPREEPHSLARLDQPVAAVATPVDDVDLAGVLVAEDEEVVAHQLELEDRLLRAHRMHRELLHLDDHGPALLVGCRPSTSLDAVALVLAVAASALLAIAGDLAFELVGEQVDRRAHVGRTLLGAQRRPFRPDRRFGDDLVRDRRVPLHSQLELDPRRVRQLALELPELLLRIGPNRVADLDVLAFDLQAHRDSPSSQGGHLAPW